VDWINGYCHENLYGKKSDAFVPGERLVSTKPVTRWRPGAGTEVILKNRFEVDVLNVVEDEIEGYKAWQVRASVVDEDRRVKLVIVDPSERKRLDAELDDLRQMALKLPKGSTERKAAWREMYKLRDAFDSVVHSFCLTCHSAQGSSYNYVYIALKDILRNRDSIERSQLQYVAYSRAMEKLVISC
jgi:superfamily I DNA/RNA helicase